MSTEAFAVVDRCQSCGSAELSLKMSLGFVPPVNAIARDARLGPDTAAYPLDLLFCRDCALLQIGAVLRSEVLFPSSYPYRSGVTRILRDNFANLAETAIPEAGLDAGDLVIDVGSNDGTLLEAFQRRGMSVHGIEPSDAGHEADRRGIPTTVAYFGAATAAAVRGRIGQARVVTAANVFAHIPDVADVMAGIDDLLAEGGVFISESHYLGDLVETVQFDTVYHEHLRYYSLTSLGRLLERHGFAAFRVERIPTHGGSIRVYAARRGERPAEPSVAALLEEERAAGLADGSAIDRLRSRTVAARRALLRLLMDLADRSQTVYGIGAPSRGSTLVNHVGIDDTLVSAILEVPDSPKIGGLLPGTRIPIEEESKLFSDPPDYALLLSWHIADELIPKLRAKGYRGRFIVPLPEPRVVD